jgi:hypothetical protein
MDDSSRILGAPVNAPDPAKLAEAWSRVMAGTVDVMTACRQSPRPPPL